MIELQLDPVSPAEAPEAWLKAMAVVSHVYGQPLELVLPEEYAEAVAGLADLQADLAKAIPAHPSHFQPRIATGKFTRRHPGNLNPRDASGRFRQRLTQSEREQAARDADEGIRDFGERLQEHLDDYLRQALDGPKFLARCRRDIARSYQEAYRNGKRAVGDPAILLSPQDRAALNRLVGDEYDYLVAFEQALAQGTTTPQWPPVRRMATYGRAAYEAFWMGWILGDQRAARELQWVYGPTQEHCGLAAGGKSPGCSDFEARGWLSVAGFVREILAQGYAPQSGALECKGIQCQCGLEERLDGKRQPAPVLPGLAAPL